MKCAQQRTVLLEDHNFYIDQAGWCAARFPCLELGRHLALQGTIARREDVFYLYEAEIREGASDPTLKLADLVADRRSSRDYWLRVTPPTYIGTGQAAPNPMLDRFFGPAQEAPREVGVVKGVAASKGVVRGTARIILDLNEVERLGPGEILITHATAPPWTPLFAVAGAVVTEAGGILSHCAVVAREYKLPAVVGAKGAIQRIRDGSLVTVDGTAGIVHIEDGA
jgi:pyruvate,water dikinase